MTSDIAHKHGHKMKMKDKTAGVKEDFKNLTTLSDFKDQVLGKKGTQRRDQYELELKAEIISELIKTKRKELHLTQTELGEKVGVKKGQISKLENQATNVTIDTIIKVFKALNVKLKIKVESEEETLNQDLVLS